MDPNTRALDAPTARWLEAHPYLQQMAGFVGGLERSARRAVLPSLPLPRWEAYAGEYAAGVPLLRGAAWSPELEQTAAAAVHALVEDAAGASLPPRLAADARALRDRLSDPAERVAAVRWLVGDGADEAVAGQGGLLRFLGWTALRAALAPLLEAFAAWRDEERWHRPTCPACGAAPAMARISGPEPGVRALSCGCCRTVWRWQRIGCPYCGEEDSGRLGALELEGEPRLRIDFCERCQGYLKTYLGEGDESVMLADWPTLHLDVLAAERGLKRLGATLYEAPGSAGP